MFAVGARMLPQAESEARAKATRSRAWFIGSPDLQDGDGQRFFIVLLGGMALERNAEQRCIERPMRATREPLR
jgi:hypothetical protein